MDRRSFLKTGAVGAAGLALGTGKAEAKPKEAKTPLEVKGYVKEPARRIPVVDSADVVVVGGGPAGFAAAVAAAREGSDVLLLERLYFLGGLFTGCGVTPIIDMFHPSDNGPRQAVFGIADELYKRMNEVGMINYDGIRPKVDPEAAKYYMEAFCAESGVRILYGVQATQVTRSGDGIDTVILDGKSGRVAIRAKFVIDASGDGDILDWVGEDFTVYKNDIGAMWRIGNAENSPKGSSPTPVKGVRTRHTVGEKDQDGLDMYNLTRIQLKLRKKMWEEVLAKRATPGNEDLYLVDTPTLVGVRITRVLDSVGNVTTEGAATGKAYPDVIGVTGGDSSLKYNGGKIPAKQRQIWQIPYTALVPRHVPNLLVAGRCFGFEKELTYDAREIGTCLVTGQAAGVAASMAAARRQSNREVDIPDLQARLKAQGVKLDF